MTETIGPEATVTDPHQITKRTARETALEEEMRKAVPVTKPGTSVPPRQGREYPEKHPRPGRLATEFESVSNSPGGARASLNQMAASDNTTTLPALTGRTRQFERCSNSRVARTAVVLEQPCSTSGRTGTVRPKHLPAGRTGLSNQFLGPVAQDQPGPVRQICPTSWLLLWLGSVRPTTGQTRLFEHRSSSHQALSGKQSTPSPDRSVRPINDLSFPHGDTAIPSVNEFVGKHLFDTTWDNFKTVAGFFKHHWEPFELGIFDWEKAYRQIPIRPEQWPYPMIQNFKGKLLLDTRITFGGVAGCGSFGCPADAWKELMLHEFELVHVFRWVDNNLFVREMGSKTSMTDIIQHSTELGVRTNKKKYAEFAATQKFIGFIWDGINKTATLSEGKAAERISQLEAFLHHKKICIAC
ncbi:hypothetical protein PCANC_04860 [Puccinia coronata f. sp. avenae]|uniref:Reverse transcriptase domain-containing protein n=1 Tax=Puccinia coronata f. sp. avenae TaxID=200324 RepID=A0A2N5W2I2_9BASI|nr:hypothetical protein PCANC_04860 [Puccinia coronata f. sp. avenae]